MPMIQHLSVNIKNETSFIYGQCMGHRDSIDYSEFGTITGLGVRFFAAKEDTSHLISSGKSMLKSASL